MSAKKNSETMLERAIAEQNYLDGIRMGLLDMVQTERMAAGETGPSQEEIAVMNVMAIEQIKMERALARQALIGR